MLCYTLKVNNSENNKSNESLNKEQCIGQHNCANQAKVEESLSDKAHVTCSMFICSLVLYFMC